MEHLTETENSTKVVLGINTFISVIYEWCR